jgi:hypothetical protein
MRLPMDYMEWNNTIAARFFRTDMAYRRVILAVTRDVIAEIGEPKGVGIEDFLAAIRTGPSWTLAETDICKKALMAAFKWQERDLAFPPYIGFLAAFVLAASGLEGFSPQAYYEPLSQLLDQPIGINQFGAMHGLWFGLRNWSRHDKEDQLGVFRPSIPTGSPYINVGLPRSQTLLLLSERSALPSFFSDNHLDPTSLPSEAILLRAFRTARFLRTSTRNLLQQSDAQGRELQSALAGFVLDELQAWDGKTEERDSMLQTVRSMATAVVLRLCLKIIPLAKRADITVRFKAISHFPDDPLYLVTASGPKWIGMESQDGWSRPLHQSKGTRKTLLDGSTLNWECGQTFRDTEFGWRVTLPPASVRLFLPGRRVGLDEEFVESAHLVPNCAFRIACRSEERAAIEAWGGSACEDFQTLTVMGLPPEWTLFSGKNARMSQTETDILRLSTRRRLCLIGGIKAENRHSFFHFNRPAITLDGGNGTEKISCVESPLTTDADGLWRFSDAAPMNTPLHITCGEESLTLTLLPTELRLTYDAPTLDAWGALTEGVGLVRGVEAPEDDLNPPPVNIPTHFGGHIVFLGRRAGELADWPADPLPETWRPVWAVVKVHRNEWQAHFVGMAQDLNAIQQARHGDWKKWREICIRRKTEAVGIKRVRDFWTQCCKEASKL